MAPVAPLRIAPSSLEIKRGVPATVTLTVYNDSDIVEGYTIRFVGLDRAWVAQTPDPLRLLPGTEGKVVATLALPDIYPAGDHEIGVQLTASSSNRQLSLVFIKVGVPPDMKATLTVTPTTVWARSQARFTAVVQNHGNTPLTLALQSADPEAAVTSEFEPQALTIEAGESARSNVVAHAKRPWVGSPVPRMITVVGKGQGEPLEALVTFMQKPRLPVWMLSVLAMLLALLVWLLALVFGLNKVLSDDKESTSDLTITGEAYVGPTEQPVGDIVVSAFALDNLDAAVSDALTAPDGTFSLDKLEAGLYKLRFTSSEFGSLWFSADGGAASAATASVVSVSESGDITPADPSVVFGRVADICGTVTFAESAAPPPSVSQSAVPPPAAATSGDCGTQGNQGTPATSSSTPTPTPTPTTTATPTPAATAMTALGMPSDSAVDTSQNCPKPTGLPKPGDLPGVVVAISRVAVAADGTTMVVPDDTMSAVVGPVETDANGLFLLPDLPSPGVYQLEFSAIGATTQTVTVSLGKDDAIVPVTLLPGTNSITGSVAPAQAFPGCLPLVTIERPPTKPGASGPNSATVAVGPDGSYVIEGLENASYKLTVSRELFQDQATIVALAKDVPAENVDIILAGVPGVIKGSIWASDHTALGGATVTVTDATNTVVKTTDDANAIFEFDGLATPQMYTVTFTKVGYVEQVLAVDLQPGMVFDHEIIMSPVAATDLSAFTGTVTNQAGSPISGASVMVTNGSDIFQVKTSDDPLGHYEITGLPPGAYTITFSKGAAAVVKSRQLANGQRLPVYAVLDLTATGSTDSLRIGAYGIGPLEIGSDAGPVIEQLTASLGAFSADTGPVPSTGAYGTCSGTTIRIVRYGALIIIITVEDGREVFAAYRLDSDFDPIPATGDPSRDLRTISGAKIGDTIEQVARLYDDLDFEVGPSADGGEFTLRWVGSDEILLHGPTTGVQPSDTIRGFFSPDACSIAS